METAVLIGVLVAAGLLMASGIWVGLVLLGAVTRLKRPTVTATHEALHGDVPGSGRL
jgi:regulator of protease activity HflC (stomatin/prohibitin superfamily)